MRSPSRSDSRPSVHGQASLTAGGTLNLCVPVAAKVKRAKFILQGPERQRIALATSIGQSNDGDRWAEAVAALGNLGSTTKKSVDLGVGGWEVLLTTKSGLRSSTARVVAAGRGHAGPRGTPPPDQHQLAVRLSAQEDGLVVVADSLPRQAELTGLEIGFTVVVLTGSLRGEWPTISGLIARSRSDMREVDLEWAIEGATFTASAPVDLMAPSNGVWEFFVVDTAGKRMPIRRGLPEGRDRRFDLSTPVWIVAFTGGVARVRGYSARDGRVRLSVVPVGVAA